MNQFLLSILIPTKDRQKQLITVLSSLNLVNDILDFEVVIQDNSQSRLGEEHLKGYDFMISYHHHTQSIPISDNIQHGIENLSGEYLLIIGDDDFVHRDIVKWVRILKKSGLDCMSYSPSRYWWPDIGGSIGGTYIEKLSYTWQISFVESLNELTAYEKAGATEIRGLPRGYHGVVKKSLYRFIKEKFGNYILGSSPDIAIAVTIALLCDRFLYVDGPLTVYGACYKSGGGMTARKQHFMKPDDATFLRRETIDNWCAELPYIWSERTIYPQTYYEVISKFNLHRFFDKERFWASFFILENNVARDYILDVFLKMPFHCKLKFIYFSLRRLTGKVLKKYRFFVAEDTRIVKAEPAKLHDHIAKSPEETPE